MASPSHLASLMVLATAAGACLPPSWGAGAMLHPGRRPAGPTPASFRVDDVRPVAAAARIRVPVLVIHGAEDKETRPDHSRRIHDALGGPKRLVVVEGAGHHDALRGPVWTVVDGWIEDALR